MYVITIDMNYFDDDTMKGMYDNDTAKDVDEKKFKLYCEKYKYLPAVLPKTNRIIAIGDIHGDLKLAKECFMIAGLINNVDEWIGGDTIVVQVGDQLDNCRPNEYKCNDPRNPTNKMLAESGDLSGDIEVLKYFTEMNNKAEKSGGKVISLLGNHELMNVMGRFEYVSLNDVNKFASIDKKTGRRISGYEGRSKAFSRSNDMAKYLACTRVSSIIVGSFLFTHAGIISEFAEKMKSRDKLHNVNAYVRGWLLGLVNESYVADIIDSTVGNGTPNKSLFWDRILGSIPKGMSNDDPKCEKYVKKALDIFGLKGMIIGHTPQSFTHHHGINATCNDTLWRVDIGASVGFNVFDDITGELKSSRKPQVLEILNDNDIKVLS